FQLARTRAHIGAVFMGVVSFAGYAALAGVLWRGGRVVAAGEGLSLGGLTKVLVYTLLVGFSLGGLSDIWADFMKASGAADRIFELLDREPLIPREGGAALAEVEGRVEFEGVRFAYPSRRDALVLAGIDLSVRPGEVVALVG